MASDGPVLVPMAAARQMLADCYYWRRLADPEDPWDDSTALAHVHYDGLPAPVSGPDHSLQELNDYRPFALLWTDQAGGLRVRATSAGFCCTKPSGVIVVQLELPVPEDLAANPSAVAEYLSRQIGRIIQSHDAAKPGLFELAGRAGYLPLNEVLLFGYVRTDDKSVRDIGDVAVAELQLSWGMD